ncbi:MAG: oligosaccharide biosynthesis protein Alg14 [Sphingobacteriaceae bacterium]|nr:MAG: oligosaccharide biosynthesis protein Alg14 [Sphingobacteriaceae bacterium]
MKILAVASAGGHWVQLLRLRPAFEGAKVVYVSTNPAFATMVAGNDYHVITEVSRWEKYKIFGVLWQCIKTIRAERPDVVISTGAAPGVLFLFAARILGTKTIWLDSIANVEKLSYSGVIASKFVNKVYTQWPDLAGGKITYAGNVLL